MESRPTSMLPLEALEFYEQIKDASPGELLTIDDSGTMRASDHSH
jgi:hypothetical protein